ncbi:MAG: hypothetical protein AAGI01_02715 [Myxococcota bacterium]
MQRIHSFEFHDQSWFPGPLRDHLTDFLTFMALRFEVYRAILPELAEVFRTTDHRRIVDLCSGAGGPVLWTVERLRDEHGIEVALTVTDLFPNEAAWNKRSLAGYPEPVDARDVPAESLKGVRTIFAGFHHFTPEDARAIMQDAVRHGQPLVVVEATRRTPFWIFATALSFLQLFWASAVMRPIRPLAMVCTYLVPVLPLVAAWDGIVSCLRTYTPEELREMWAEVEGSEGWHFDARVVRDPSSPAEITLCIATLPVEVGGL